MQRWNCLHTISMQLWKTPLGFHALGMQILNSIAAYVSAVLLLLEGKWISVLDYVHIWGDHPLLISVFNLHLFSWDSDWNLSIYIYILEGVTCIPSSHHHLWETLTLAFICLNVLYLHAQNPHRQAAHIHVYDYPLITDNKSWAYTTSHLSTHHSSSKELASNVTVSRASTTTGFPSFGHEWSTVPCLQVQAYIWLGFLCSPFYPYILSGTPLHLHITLILRRLEPASMLSGQHFGLSPQFLVVHHCYQFLYCLLDTPLRCYQPLVTCRELSNPIKSCSNF